MWEEMGNSNIWAHCVKINEMFENELYILESLL